MMGLIRETEHAEETVEGAGFLKEDYADNVEPHAIYSLWNMFTM